VLVTRPEPEASAWVDALASRGVDAVALPLLAIHPAPDQAALQAALTAAATYSAIMWVSPQAVLYSEAPAWVHASGRCWAPGPGTARALLQRGVAPSRIDQPLADSTQFDADALWSVVAAQVHPGHRLLVLRGVSPDGRSGRDDFINRCRAAGSQVDVCTAYGRGRPVWTTAQRALARQSLHGQVVWLLSSSEAVRYLPQLLPGVSFHHTRALVTHPRIALSAREQGFGEIITTRPTMDEVVQGLLSCR